MGRAREDTDSYAELFTVGQGFVHVLDRPLLAPSHRRRTLRLWLVAAVVWSVAALSLALLVGLLATRPVGASRQALASEEMVLPAAAAGPAAPASALGGLCGPSAGSCDDALVERALR